MMIVNAQDEPSKNRPMIVEFHRKVSEVLLAPLVSARPQSLQINVGYLCNMSCKHCHVKAGPNRSEVMGKAIVDQVLDVIRHQDLQTLDITGGAPEMNPHFKYLVRQAKNAGCHVIVRSNLTIFFEDGYEKLPDFYRDHNVEITASLPYYLDSNVDRVRGEGTFGKTIEAIGRLNRIGYGNGNGRKLNLVHNPAGTFLATEQRSLEEDYRRELGKRYGITFDHLYVFSNMPIGRFRNHLENTGSLAKYLKTLEDSFNPATLSGLMCRQLISVAWDGSLFDCDYNQVLGLQLHDSCPRHIQDFDYERLAGREIRVGDHCYGCTAGHGST